MNSGRRILICDDDDAVRSSLGFLLTRNGYSANFASHADSILNYVKSTGFDLVLLDMNFSALTSGEEGLNILKEIKTLKPKLPVVLITAWGSVELAVRGIKTGASDFILKPWNNSELLKIIETSISLSEKKAPEGSGMKERKDNEFASIIGNDPRLIEILDVIRRVAPTHAPVLITGESGTGKELIASAIHEYSKRSTKPFVKVNLGGIPSALFESEMFGHKKGAFTDAKTDHEGRFERADKGSIFLDEIGDLDLSSQVKLLRVLQDQTFEKVGSSESITVDVRIISATNHDLYDKVSNGSFREDLLYRINLVQIEVPPLRKRKTDIPVLAEYFAARAASSYSVNRKSISPSACNWLCEQAWPGNVRELKNMIERTMLLSSGDQILPEDFQAVQRSGSKQQSNSIRSLSTLDDMEKSMIIKTLEETGNNIARSSDRLGISRATLYRKMEKHGIHPGRNE